MPEPKDATKSTQQEAVEKKGGNGSSSINRNPASVESQTMNAFTMTKPPSPEAAQTMIPASGTYDEYVIKPNASWPPPVFAKRNITPQERYYLENRWFSQWKYFDARADDNKRRYFLYQWIIGAGSVAVPILVTIRTQNIIVTESIYIITIIISFAVAYSAAVEGLYKYGEMWRSYRQAAEELLAEKSFYDMGSGRYLGLPDPFARFVERTEEIIAQQNGRFIQSTERQQVIATERGQEILEKYYEEEHKEKNENTIG